MSCKCDERAVCRCDGPYGPLSDVYYDESALATVYHGEYRYRVFLMPNRETYRIEVDATVYDASGNVEQGMNL